jgi:hypothetical protein
MMMQLTYMKMPWLSCISKKKCAYVCRHRKVKGDEEKMLELYAFVLIDEMRTQ